jgi:hypothetical protein
MIATLPRKFAQKDGRIEDASVEQIFGLQADAAKL